MGRFNQELIDAGILRTAPFLETSDKDWRDTFGVNLDGAFYVSRAFGPDLIARQGRIINIASDAVPKGVMNYMHYVTSKSAMIG